MKKNGFTLVEVLTTIVIIGLLLLIAVPSITKVLEKSRQDTFDRQVGFLLEAGQDYFTEKILKDPNSIVWLSRTISGIDITYASVSLQTLIDNGNIKAITDPKTKEACEPYSSFVETIKHSETKYTYSISLVCDTYSYDDSVANIDQALAFTIPSSNVDADLEYFPVTIFLNHDNGSDGVFTEIGEENLKIRFTLSDMTTPLYGEIEYWDSTAGGYGEAVIHVSGAELTLDNNDDTIIYMFYDAEMADNTDYIGVVGSEAGEGVWNSGYVLIYHMDSSFLDSTSNDNDGTANGTSAVSGSVGYATSFNGTSDYVATSYDPGVSSDITLTAMFTPLDTDDFQIIFNNDSSVGGYNFIMRLTSADIYDIARYDGSSYQGRVSYTPTSLYGVPVVLAGTHNMTSGDIFLYADDGLLGSDNNNTSITIDTPYYIGINPQVDTDNYFYGTIDEARISNVVRSPEWIAAEYLSLTDQLITY